MSLNNESSDLPPVGKFPADKFERWKKEELEARLAVEYIDLTKYPQFTDALETVVANTNGLRLRNGSNEIQLNLSQVRFVDEKDWKTVWAGLGRVTQETADALVDRTSNNIFAKCDMEDFGKDPEDMLWNLYVVAHEFGHMALPELEKYSFDLSEGLTDTLAKYSLNEDAFNTILGKDSYAFQSNLAEAWINELKPKTDGLPVTIEEILFIKKDGRPIGFTRIPQMRLISSLKSRLGQKTFGNLLRLAFKGNIDEISTLVKSELGSQIETLLNNKMGSESVNEIRELIDRS